MATSDVVINNLIHFDVEDTELEKLLLFLYAKGLLRMDCTQCGTTIVPQCRNKHTITGESEFKINCVNCSKVLAVRMYGSYGFILPTDDEFYAAEEEGKE